MREILFRGKHIHVLQQNKPLDGIWAYGYLSGENYINTIDEDEYGGEFTSEVLVDPETVCQYTGLTDKNGRKIFEGDILNVTYSDQQGECHYVENYVLDDLRKTSVMGWLDYANELEVVGNIFDNTELVE